MTDIKLIEVKEDILSDNDAAAEKLRAVLKKEKTFMVNLMASPGAGKTSLLLQTLPALKQDLRMAVIEADIDSMVDAEKIAATGIESIQLRTGGFCHLDVSMVKKGLAALDLAALDLIFIENVGNLVCPAEFDTGATIDIMILSVPEGDDKPLKYPLMFSKCRALIVNKTDYLSLSDFNMDLMEERVRKLNPEIEIFKVSCKTGEGIDGWTLWLKKKVTDYLGA
ncbi:MAG: hydrogenase accessory protein HypB [Desulfobacterales bacterium CG23_combo_of_CG06-09_8_20_14_all_51_8]|nr:MAG: hydrogenase accessory protein HypB [Desulfobacterales bacterium CG23_combo_of_CG06-09_8_20_14_all_51_8]